MNKFIKLTVVIYVLMGVILILVPQNWFPDFYKPNFMAILAFVSAFLIVLPGFIFKSENARKKHSLEKIQIILAIGLLINGLGGLGLYKLYLIGFQYDKLTHFITPLIFSVGLAYFLEAWFGLTLKKALVFSVAMVIFGSFLWEFLEWFSDYFFDTELLGGGTGQILRDTLFDLMANAVGIFVGVFYLLTHVRR